MIKSLAAISDAINSSKHPFRKVDSHPTKPSKHRYERRKLRACLQLGAWSFEPTNPMDTSADGIH